MSLTFFNPTPLLAKDKEKDSSPKESKQESKQSDSKVSKADNSSKSNDIKGKDARDNNSDQDNSKGNGRSGPSSDRGNHDRGDWRGSGGRGHIPFYYYPSHHHDQDYDKLKGKLLAKLTKAIRQFQNHKVTVCHKGHAISISRDALCAHLAHGDTIGRCDVTPTKNH